MEQFERQFENLDVQSQFVESAMNNQASLSTPEEDVNMLMQQVCPCILRPYHSDNSSPLTAHHMLPVCKSAHATDMLLHPSTALPLSLNIVSDTSLCCLVVAQCSPHHGQKHAAIACGQFYRSMTVPPLQ